MPFIRQQICPHFPDEKTRSKSNIMEILYGIPHLLGSPTRRFPHVVRPSSTFSSVGAVGTVPSQEVKRDRTYPTTHIHLQPQGRPVAAQMVPHNKASQPAVPSCTGTQYDQRHSYSDRSPCNGKYQTPSNDHSASSPARLSYHILTIIQEGALCLH